MKNLAFASFGTCLALSLFSAPASCSEPAYDSVDYSDNLMAMNVPAAHENYIGEGVALVHMEDKTIFLDALDTDREPVFGNCTIAAGAISDATGWEPAGDNCQIEWVMCFKVGWGGQRVQNCSFEADRNHATNVVKGMTVVAPAAKIISIKINGTDGRAYKLAAEWLTTPSADSEWYADNNFSPDEASHYNNYFGGKSPAEFWNVVAINGSFRQAGLGLGSTLGKEGRVPGIFSESCEVYNDTTDFRPQKFIVDWWADHKVDKKQFLAYTGFDTGSAILQEHEIMPIFAASNFLWLRKYKDIDGNTQTERFVTQNGVAFPACLAETFAVSGIASNYGEVSGRNKYIGSNVHPHLTDFVAPGSGAASFSTPMVAGAVAVLRSSNLMPDASIDDIVRYLGATRLDDAGQVENKAEVGFSCDPIKRVPQDRDLFPGGPGSYWNEHKSLDCNNGDPVPTPYKSPYTKVVIDLGAATELAAQDRRRKFEISIKPDDEVNRINTKSRSAVSVAILGSETFDVIKIDTSNLLFGPKGYETAAPADKKGGRLKDVNSDGYDDLVSKYRQQESGLAPSDTEACVYNAATDDTDFEACDSVSIVN